jgi:hypothetical protein
MYTCTIIMVRTYVPVVVRKWYVHVYVLYTCTYTCIIGTMVIPVVE